MIWRKGLIGHSGILERNRRRKHQQRLHTLRVEQLEAKRLLASDLSPGETMLLYLVNQTRNDPHSAAERLSVWLPSDQFGPFQPVVPNESLHNAAQAHSDDMLVNNMGGHTGSDGSSPGERALRFGYETDGVGENAAAGYSVNQPPADAESLARATNDSWFSSSAHRQNMLTANWTEFGGAFSESFTQSSGGSNWSWRATELFGKYDSGPFLVGVVFNDQNEDSAYNVGEGLGGVSVTVTGPTGTFSTTTMSAGAWYLKVPAGEYLVSASGGEFIGASSVPVQVANGNKSVDFISGQPNAWVNFEQHVNSAPVLATSGGNNLPAVLSSNATSDGATVAALLGTSFSDPDVIGLRGIAITNVPATSIGSWQYSLNQGSTWLNLGSPTDTAARLLAAENLVRFVPNDSGTGSTVFSYRAWDRTAGQSGGTASVTSSGGQSPFSVAGATARATVIGTNTAPTLLATGGNEFQTVYEDVLSHSGTTVSHLIGTAYQDPDSSSAPGIALTELTGVESGTWSYSTDDGWSWFEISPVSSTQALLLRPSDQLSFRPNENQTPEFSATFRLWDQSSGRAGTRIDVASQQAVGGASAFSTGERTVSAVVVNTNDAPTLDPDASSLRLRPIAMSSGWNGTLTTVSDLLGNAVIDPDPAAELGIALVGVGANGTAFFKIGSQFGWRTVSPATATLLQATDSVGFNPTSGFNGESSISFRVWDQTQGTTSSATADLSQPVSATGGSTAFSREVFTARVFVGPAGEAPRAEFQAVTMRPDQSAAQSVELTFTEAITGFDIGDLRLTRDGSPVSLSGASLSESGTSFLVSGLEQATSAAGTYVLQLPLASTGISDAAGNRLNNAAQLTFSVARQNLPPSDVALSSGSIPENMGVNSVLGTFSTIDPDAGDTFTYTLVSGTGDTDNASFEIIGGEIRAREVFDFETKNAYTIRVRSTDAGGLFSDKAFTITITDVNELPSFNAIQDLSIGEDAGQQLIALTEIASGDDVSQPVRITATSSNLGLVPNPSVTYATPGTTGSLAFTPLANQYGTATITVTVEDGGLDGDLATSEDNASVAKTFDVTVDPLNDAPVLDPTASPALNSVNEDAGPPVGAVGTLVSSLIDAGGPLNNFSDIDGDLPGIAITGANLQGGKLWFSLNNGLNWREVGPVSPYAARLLAADALTRIYFEPLDGHPGQIADLISFKAWDGTGDARNGDALYNTEIGGGSAGIGNLALDSEAVAIAVVADTGLVLAGTAEGSALLFDITVPSAPIKVAGLDGLGGVQHVAYDPSTLRSYVSTSDGLVHVIDMSSPLTPTLLSTYELYTDPEDETSIGRRGRGSGLGLSRDGALLVVADGTNGVHVLNVGDPASISQLAFVNSAGRATSVAWSPNDRVAFVADGPNGILSIDVRDHTNVEVSTAFTVSSNVTDLAVNGDGSRLYAASSSAGVLAFSVSAENGLAFLTSYVTPGAARSVVADPLTDFLFVCDGLDGVHMLDASTPEGLVYRGSYEGSFYTRDAALSAHGNYLFALDTNAGLWTLRTSGARPRGYPQPITEWWTPYGSIVEHPNGTHLIASGRRDGESVIDVLDTTGAASPSIVATFGPRNTRSRYGQLTVDQSGEYLYVDDRDGLTVLDISTLSSPSFLKQERNIFGGRFVAGPAPTLAYSADGDFQIVDFSTPESPRIVGAADTPGTASTMVALKTKSYAVVADGTGGVHVIDLGDQDAPEIVATVRLPGDSINSAWDVVVSDDETVAFVATARGLLAIDISDPINPLLQETVSPIYIRDLYLSADANTLYATTTESLVAFDIRESSAPKRMFSLFSEQASLLWIRGIVEYGNGGIVILDSSGQTVVWHNPTRPDNVSTTADIFGVRVVGFEGTFESKAFDVQENNSLEVVVGAFEVTDGSPDGSYSFILIDGEGSTHNSLFRIEGSSLLCTVKHDHEEDSQLSVRVRAVDAAGFAREQVFTITVADVNEVPTSVSLVNRLGHLSETANTSTATKLADIHIADDALGSNTVTLSGPDATFFEIGSQGSLYLKAGVSLDYVAKPTLSVTVSARDTSIVGSSPVTVGYTLDIIPRSPHLTTGSNGQLFIDGQPVSYADSPVTSSFESWTIFEAAVIRAQNLFFAQHSTGVIHRLYANADWSLVGGLYGVGNAYSIYLPRSARGPEFPVTQESEPLPADLLIPLEISGTQLRIDPVGQLYANEIMLTRQGSSTGVKLTDLAGFSPIAIMRENTDTTWRNTLLWQHRIDRSLVEWQFNSDWGYQGNSRVSIEGSGDLELAYQVDVNRDTRIG